MALNLSELMRLPIAVPRQLGEDIRAIVTAVERLPALIGSLDRRIEAMQADVAEVRATATNIQLHLITLGNDLTDTRAVVAGIQGTAGHIGQTVDAVSGRVDDIAQGLDERIPDLTPVPADVHRITRDVARVLELTPDPDEPGTFERVKEALTPGD